MVAFSLVSPNTMSSPTLTTALKAHDLSITKSRQKVFDCLSGQEPQSMAEVIRQVAPDVNRASVYRIIALFESIGITHRVYIGWKYKIELTDAFMHHHHHLSCLKCGRVIHIHDNESIDQFIANVSAKHNFTPTQHQFEITGYCDTCQA